MQRHQTPERFKKDRNVGQFALLNTERVAPKTMSRSAKGTVDAPGRRVRQKAGLNREILSAGFGMAHPMLAYKAEEAGARLHLSNTRQIKPSQCCAACWELVPKTLAQRVHVWPHCGHTAPRDQNSAMVVLTDAHNTQDTPGTGVAARPKPRPRQRGKSKSVTRETPATTPCVERRESSSRYAKGLRDVRTELDAAPNAGMPRSAGLPHAFWPKA
ncbi:zinc ribbon domain-containing protein [Thiomonas sp. FB-Cd]|uniref:zinc ribbon domain-containing protein n=1 Tax=Thiomonas sp. FB-Cd TaxID=1158292 RepID=UPI0004DFB87B|nr:zinc ribbon domain-containing protein [Thiomonas sp. FB-Cd]